MTEISSKQHAKIEVASAGAQCIIRITADKATATETLESFDDLWSSLIHKTIPIRDPANYDKENLAVIADLTRTAFTLHSNKKVATSHHFFWDTC
jgi:hypothetical protein